MEDERGNTINVTSGDTPRTLPSDATARAAQRLLARSGLPTTRPEPPAPPQPSALERSMTHRGVTAPVNALSPFTWTLEAEAAAMALAGVTLPPGHLSPFRVGQAVGVSSTQIKTWQCHPEFRDRVTQIAQAASAAFMLEGVALKEQRVAALRDRHALLTEIIAARQEHWAEQAPGDTLYDQEAGEVTLPGLGTGLLVLDKKQIGGEFGVTVLTAATDAVLLRELRAIEEHIAKETGQWNPGTAQTVNVKLYAGVDIDRV